MIQSEIDEAINRLKHGLAWGSCWDYADRRKDIETLIKFVETSKKVV